MIANDYSVNRVHLYYTARTHFSNIEMGDIVTLGDVHIRHKSSRTKANGERVYTYVATRSEQGSRQGWRIHVRVRATADSFSVRIERQYPVGCMKTYAAVNNWRAEICR
jgi:hypothetical protein